MNKTFYYSIQEQNGELIKFNYPKSVLGSSDCIEFLCERAAHLHFMGDGGWKCEMGWPLTFNIFSERKLKLGACHIFILNGENPPILDVIKIN